MFAKRFALSGSARTGLLGSGAMAATLALLAGNTLPVVADDSPSLPESIVLTGVVRDFRGCTEANGHPDFDRPSNGGTGILMGAVHASLDAEGKPVMAGPAYPVLSPWRDSRKRDIHPSLFRPAMGDTPGSLDSAPHNCDITSADTFAEWFRSVPDVNLSKAVTLTLVKKNDGSNFYVFDDANDPVYKNRKGFFPINADLFGNTAGESNNYHFTYELSTEFRYIPGAGSWFSVASTDDVWVFVNGRLVIDMGGVHSVSTQTVHLDRLAEHLYEDAPNTIKIFMAERQRHQCNFRIAAKDLIPWLRSAELPPTSALYD